MTFISEIFTYTYIYNWSTQLIMLYCSYVDQFQTAELKLEGGKKETQISGYRWNLYQRNRKRNRDLFTRLLLRRGIFLILSIFDKFNFLLRSSLSASTFSLGRRHLDETRHVTRKQEVAAAKTNHERRDAARAPRSSQDGYTKTNFTQ